MGGARGGRLLRPLFAYRAALPPVCKQHAGGRWRPRVPRCGGRAGGRVPPTFLHGRCQGLFPGG
jgi:hypothetical protein